MRSKRLYQYMLFKSVKVLIIQNNKIMKRKFIYSSILIVGLVLVGSTSNKVNGQTQKPTTTKQETMQYTCPVHTKIVKDNHGKCPICGMALVKKSDLKKNSMHQMRDSTGMNRDNMKMKHDSIGMKHHQMMGDSTGMKQHQIKGDTTQMRKGMMQSNMQKN